MRVEGLWLLYTEARILPVSTPELGSATWYLEALVTWYEVLVTWWAVPAVLCAMGGWSLRTLLLSEWPPWQGFIPAGADGGFPEPMGQSRGWWEGLEEVECRLEEAVIPGCLKAWLLTVGREVKLLLPSWDWTLSSSLPNYTHTTGVMGILRGRDRYSWNPLVYNHQNSQYKIMNMAAFVCSQVFHQQSTNIYCLPNIHKCLSLSLYACVGCCILAQLNYTRLTAACDFPNVDHAFVSSRVRT